MRDSKGNMERLNKHIEFEEDYLIKKNKKIERLKSDIEQGIENYPISTKKVLRNNQSGFIDGVYTIILSKYSRGDDLSELYKYFKIIADTYEEAGYNVTYINKFVEIFSLGILLEVHITDLKKLTKAAYDKNLNEKPLNDLMFEFLASSCGLRRFEKSDSFENDTYRYTKDVVNTAFENKEKAMEMLAEYMKKEWLKGRHGSGYKKVYNEVYYYGFWSFEGAAIAKIFGLNDECLKNNNHYPYDLRHYKNKMKFLPSKMVEKEKEKIVYKHGIPKNRELEKLIPLPYHELANTVIEDYYNLPDDEVCEKYEMYEITDDYTAMKEESEKGLLGLILVFALADAGYILELDWKEEVEDYDLYSQWGDVEVKLVEFSPDGDTCYYAYVPKNVDIEWLYEVYIRYDIDDEPIPIEKKGIDFIYENTHPDAKCKYVITESKYNTARLVNTKDGKQMSNNWLEINVDGKDKILNSVNGSKEIAKDVREQIKIYNVEKVLTRLKPDGTIKFTKLDEDATKDGEWP